MASAIFNCNTDGHQWRSAGFRFHNGTVPAGKRQCAVCACIEDAPVVNEEARASLRETMVKLARQAIPSLKLRVNEASRIAQPSTDLLNGNAYETLLCGIVVDRYRRYRVTRTVDTLVLFRLE